MEELILDHEHKGDKLTGFELIAPNTVYTCAKRVLKYGKAFICLMRRMGKQQLRLLYIMQTAGNENQTEIESCIRVVDNTGNELELICKGNE